MKPIINLDELEFGSHQHGESFQACGAQVSSLIGGSKLGYGVTVVPPGKRAWPFHNHHANEEMFFVLSGCGKLRFGSDEYDIRAGDFIAAPAGGKSTAHQIINNSAAELRYISVSTMLRPEIVEYPDSNKFSASAIQPGSDSGFRHLGVVMPAVDYWQGES
ncbi:MAG TPA: cupin domain-containing protein [Ideonella sp.]|uniref:cupin domain-containing protein n=1 Tax=Ideonella sp. TaxID=1929293 RepID=UPI002E377DBD|nr:cupin domain-containing protein [Ideonella sp.]HEX5686804.1 cupin domain-containing protein [Ideonella sp.]